MRPTICIKARRLRTIGMLIDTSRDGWGGPNRPTGWRAHVHPPAGTGPALTSRAG